VPSQAQSDEAGGGGQRKSSGFLTRKRTASLGCLQTDMMLPQPAQETRLSVPDGWRGPAETSGEGLERSELGLEVTVEVRRWLAGEITGLQCAQVVLDRALTVLANFKLASGCQLEVLGGPLGAIVGGYSDADWLHDEVFRRHPATAVREAFVLLGFRPHAEGDWSNVTGEEVSLSYRRLCLRGHPSRGGPPRGYLKLQVAMEVVRAFGGEAGPIVPSDLGEPQLPPRRKSGDSRDRFVLDDLTLVRELELTAQEAEEEATKLPQEQLEEMNRALDEYILRQMCFKSEIIDEIARLHENCAYAILGISSDATDSEIRKAYRFIAMQCHPDKGGDKEDFQELNNAYEKIMEQRRGSGGKGMDDDDQSDSESPVPKSKGPKAEKDKEPEEGPEEKATADGEGAEGQEGSGAEPDCSEEGSNAALVEKASRAAEEASRYAKTAAEFAHQAAEAAETARRGKEQGSRDTLTKSIAHSAIVLTLTVVKAVRVVGYATLDVAAQCRIAAKRNTAAGACGDRAVTAMSLGLEALNAALACAEVTETTAAELQAQVPAGCEGKGAEGGCTAAAERFVGAAVRASLAAASASNAAMSAAIAAVEGSRECMRAMEAQKPAEETAKGEAEGEEDAEGEEKDEEDEGEQDAQGDDDSSAKKQEEPAPAGPTSEGVARRLVAQRNNNHKVLQRLNAEILGHQNNVRTFLQSNRVLIPDITGEAKQKVFRLLADYIEEGVSEIERLGREMSERIDDADTEGEAEEAAARKEAAEEILEAVQKMSLLVPFVQPKHHIAISVSVKARVLKLAGLYDFKLTQKSVESELFGAVRAALQELQHAASLEVAERLCATVLDELRQSVAAEDEPDEQPAPANPHPPASADAEKGV